MERSANNFATTRWTRVIAARGASPEAQEALSDLCALNYAPVLRFLRASGHAPGDAQELAHDFFAHVLEHRSLEGVDPARGRFRTYLLGALKHFVTKARVRESRLKRGGGLEAVPLENGTDTPDGAVPSALRAEAPDALFDREWALAVIDRALATIEQESAAAGSREVFDCLKPWLSASSAPGSQADVAARLNMSEGAVKVAIHRLRKSFRQAVRYEVAQTVQDESEVAGEMQHLIAALSA
jgi:DNA-directed RNA polymerase specialized sigma24 family protein